MEQRLCEPLNSTTALFVGSIESRSTSCRGALLIEDIGSGESLNSPALVQTSRPGADCWTASHRFPWRRY